MATSAALEAKIKLITDWNGLIEAWCFATPEALERVLGQQVSAEWLAQGKRDPKEVLRRLAETNQKQWNLAQAISTLDAQDIERIRAIPEVAALSTFLHELQKGDQAA